MLTFGVKGQWAFKYSYGGSHPFGCQAKASRSMITGFLPKHKMPARGLDWPLNFFGQKIKIAYFCKSLEECKNLELSDKNQANYSSFSFLPISAIEEMRGRFL